MSRSSIFWEILSVPQLLFIYWAMIENYFFTWTFSSCHFFAPGKFIFLLGLDVMIISTIYFQIFKQKRIQFTLKSRWYFQIRALSHASSFSFCKQMVLPVRLISIIISLIAMIRPIFRLASLIHSHEEEHKEVLAAWASWARMQAMQDPSS